MWFAYTPDRKGIHRPTHLANYKGVPKADVFAGFNAFYENGTIQEAAYWAHARRKFYDLHEASPSELKTEALRRIGELYAIEAKIRGKLSNERQQVRQAEAKPLIGTAKLNGVDLEAWLRHVLAHIADYPVDRVDEFLPWYCAGQLEPA